MWNRLANADKPIVLYGTGNAAEKIIAELNKRNITIAGIFASDGFVRSRTFAGYTVLSYKEAKNRFGDMIVLLCFGSHLPDVIDNIKRIDSEQELYAPDLPIAGEGLFTCTKEQVESTAKLLADSKSIDVLKSVVDYKLSGEIKYLLSAETPDSENWKLFNLSQKESYLDLGAYNGDTVLEFLSNVDSKYANIIAVEPENRNFKKLLASTNNLKRIEYINKAIGREKGVTYFSKARGRGGKVNDATKSYEVEVDSVDNLAFGKEISFIKMDLEGAEQDAILGAKDTIKRCKPKMLISAYHRNDDLFIIPKLVIDINPNYKVFLRKSPCLPAWEVNYYFV